MEEQVLEARNITKVFPGTIALDDVSLKVKSGTIHAVLGKNGSGKSTLMKIFSGVYGPTTGSVYLNGKECTYHSIQQAFEQGVATVYQELSLIKDLTVAENILMGNIPMKNRAMIDWAKTRKVAQEILDRLNVKIDINETVKNLSVGEQQVVEIAKAMAHNPKVLILDEPTSALSDSECESLFKVVLDLKKKGLIILFISHRLQEIFRIADYVTVLRDGHYIGTEAVENLTTETLIEMMFGNIVQQNKEINYTQDEIVMSVKNLTTDKLNDVSIELKKGEVLGIAGMMGAGRTELLETIYGLYKIKNGEISIFGKTVKNPKPFKVKKLGVGFACENRKEDGLCLPLSIGDNLVMANLKAIGPNGIIKPKLEKEYIETQITDLSIKVSDYHFAVESLSGGNQQKVVVGNWLNTKPKILLLDEPSKGIDVQAKQQIFQIVWRAAAEGVSTVMVSSELEELLEVCDRVVIMQEGRVVGDYPTADLSLESIYSLCIQEGA